MQRLLESVVFLCTGLRGISYPAPQKRRDLVLCANLIRAIFIQESGNRHKNPARQFPRFIFIPGFTMWRTLATTRAGATEFRLHFTRATENAVGAGIRLRAGCETHEELRRVSQGHWGAAIRVYHSSNTSDAWQPVKQALDGRSARLRS
jgi:hypothetical protein